MKRIAVAIAGLLTLGAGSALAQYGYPPRPMMPIGAMPRASVFDMVRQMGLEPLGPPVRNGSVYIQRAADYYGRPLRVVIDASRAQVVSVEPVGGPPMVHRGPYASTGAPYLGRPYGRYGAMPMDEDEDYGPPGSMMGPHGLSPEIGAPQKPRAKSAAVTPQHPPTPRKRPSSAPQEAAGSVEPVQAAPTQAAPAAAPPPAAPEAKPAAPEMTPVAPLN